MPTAAPGIVADGTPRPSDQAVAPSPNTRADDRPGSSPEAGTVAAAPDRPPSPPGAPTPNRRGIATVAFDEARGVSIDLASLADFDGLGTWAVPAYTLGLPGIIVVLWVGLQALGALAWLPAMRRLRGDDEEPEAE